METLRGTARKVDSYVIKSYGRGVHAGRMTHHTSRFQINGRNVKFATNSPHSINEGDQLIVAGIVRSGSLDAHAYKNLTTGVDGHRICFFPLVGGVIFLLVGFLLPLSLGFDDFSRSRSPVLLMFIVIMWIGMFSLFGCLLLHFGVQTLHAVNVLRKEDS